MTEENWKTNNCISEKIAFESPLEKPTLTTIELREHIKETEKREKKFVVVFFGGLSDIVCRLHKTNNGNRRKQSGQINQSIIPNVKVVYSDSLKTHRLPLAVCVLIVFHNRTKKVEIF